MTEVDELVMAPTRRALDGAANPLLVVEVADVGSDAAAAWPLGSRTAVANASPWEDEVDRALVGEPDLARKWPPAPTSTKLSFNLWSAECHNSNVFPPKHALGPDTQVMKDKPDARIVLRIGQLAGGTCETPNHVAAVHAARL